MREAARRVVEGYSEVGAGGTHQARLERDAAADLTRRRLAALDIGSTPLCFGRLDLDLDPEPGPDAVDGRVYYVGRIAVTDDDQAPLIVDWRAPVSEPFYRATAVEPMDVIRRIRTNEAVLLYGRELPAHVRLRPSFERKPQIPPRMGVRRFMSHLRSRHPDP